MVIQYMIIYFSVEATLDLFLLKRGSKLSPKISQTFFRVNFTLIFFLSSISVSVTLALPQNDKISFGGSSNTKPKENPEVGERFGLLATSLGKFV